MHFYTNITEHRGKILVREYTSEKGHTQSRQDFIPKLFKRTNNTNTPYKTIHNQPLDLIKFKSISHARSFVKQYKDVDGMDIYGMSNNYPAQYINENYKNLEYDVNKVRINIIDIETKVGKGKIDTINTPNEITTITLYKKTENKFYAFGQKDFDINDKRIKHINVKYTKCDDEEDLLIRFITEWKKEYCDITSGWNDEGFDWPYLINRTKMVLGEEFSKKYSPWGLIKEKIIYVNNKEQTIYELVGITILDYLLLYKKHTFSSQENFKLNNIAYVELGTKKIDYSDFKGLDDLYEKDFQKYMVYNIIDVYLVMRIDLKKKFFNLVMTLAYYIGCNYKETYSEVRSWDIKIYNHLLNDNVVIPPNKYNKKVGQIAGGFVKDPQKGFCDWIVSFDLNSLYPSLIRNYNIGVESLIEYKDLPKEIKEWTSNDFNVDDLVEEKIDTSILKKYDLSMTANKQFFKRDKQSFLSVLMEELYATRKSNKKKMLECKKELEKNTDVENIDIIKNNIDMFNNMQLSQKVLLNAAYGAVANNFFRFFDTRLAEGITISGQLSIKWISHRLNIHLNKLFKTNDRDYVLAIDTDSCYLNFNHFVELLGKNKSKEEIVDMLDNICKTKIEPFIEEKYKELSNYMNSYTNNMVMGREGIAERGLWVVKKRYILNLWDMEGVRYSKPKKKIMGLEAIKKSTPEICRDWMNEIYDLILTKPENISQEFISQKRQEWKGLKNHQIASPLGVNHLEKYDSHDESVFIKGTPANSKASLIYNKMINKYDLLGIYDEIEEGDKIRYVPLKEPNNIKQKSIAFHEFLPKEFDLDEYIDYNSLFEKNFIKSLKSIFDSIGWSIEPISNLDEFY